MFKHGMTNTRFYKIWECMKERCLRLKHCAYKNYGGRGIKVCERWMRFENFRDDMFQPYEHHVKKFGEKQTELDRIDNEGDYKLDNCRWATRKEQCNNSRNNKLISFNGQTLNVTQWSEKIGILRSSLINRLEKWDIKKALSLPRIQSKVREYKAQQT